MVISPIRAPRRPIVSRVAVRRPGAGGLINTALMDSGDGPVRAKTTPIAALEALPTYRFVPDNR
jgi:hypothetical protein